MSIASLFQRLFGKRSQQPGNEGSTMPNFDDYIYNDKKADDVTETVALKEKQVSYGALAEEYRILWDTLNVRQSRIADIDAIVDQILQNKTSYDTVSHATHVPWYVVAAIHNLESGLDFSTHLHNGNPLSGYTVDEPAGRPKTHEPPFTWEESAVDAIAYDGLNAISDWSIEKIAYHLEAYNGFGYRRHHPNVKSPYLWSFSNHYDKGRYIGDQHWSEESASDQCGAMVLLCQMIARGVIVSPPMDGDAPFAAATVSDLSPFQTEHVAMPLEIEAGVEQPLETDLSDTNANDNISPADMTYTQPTIDETGSEQTFTATSEQDVPLLNTNSEQGFEPAMEHQEIEPIVESTRHEWVPEAERFVSEGPVEPMAASAFAGSAVYDEPQHTGSEFISDNAENTTMADVIQTEPNGMSSDHSSEQAFNQGFEQQQDYAPETIESSAEQPLQDTAWNEDNSQSDTDPSWQGRNDFTPAADEMTNLEQSSINMPMVDEYQDNSAGTQMDAPFQAAIEQPFEAPVPFETAEPIYQEAPAWENTAPSDEPSEPAAAFVSDMAPMADTAANDGTHQNFVADDHYAPIYADGTQVVDVDANVSSDLLDPVELIEPIVTADNAVYSGAHESVELQQPLTEPTFEAPADDMIQPTYSEPMTDAPAAFSDIEQPVAADPEPMSVDMVAAETVIGNPVPEWFATAQREIGTRDFPGPFYEPRVFAYLQTTLQNPTNDETTWSSAFVNWCLAASGHSGTNDTNARTWLNYGDVLSEPQTGCIVVLWKGSTQSHHGQVGFFDGFEGNRVRVLGAHAAGGTDWEEVFVSTYPVERVLGYRWPRDKQNELIQQPTTAEDGSLI